MTERDGEIVNASKNLGGAEARAALMHDAVRDAIALIRTACDNGHYWRSEQQTEHRVCAWCNACDDPACPHPAWTIQENEA